MAAAATAETLRSGASSAGDSYIGSLISLTSKCEIRYEGVLYDINTQESSIGLRNVRSFGTEGRNKDGPQIPASEKVYEYILFRGSDIKDLQVKSSPPAHNVSIHNDPAIIQSHYFHSPAPSTSFPSAASGITSDLSSHTAHLGLPRMPFQGNMPPYQAAGSLGSWASSPAPPTANGSGLAVPGSMPMYWPGYYAPTGTLPPHLQQPPLMHPPPGLSIQSMQQPLPYSGMSTSLPSGSQNLQEIPSPLLPTFSSTLGSTSATTVPSTSASIQASSLAPEVSSCQMPTKPTVTSLHAAALGANLSFMPQFASSLELVASLSPNMPAIISSNPNLIPVSNVSNQAVPQPVSSIFGSASSYQTETSSANAPFLLQLASNSEYVASVSQNMPTSFSSNPRAVPISNVNYETMAQSVPSNVGPPNSSQVERPVPLVTPDQLLQPASSAVSSQPLQTSTKDVEVKPQESKNKPLLPEPSVPAPAKTKEPILPLPMPTRQKPNGAVLHTHDISRGRGRGRGRGHGYPRRMTKFTEDFDFTAMNEKFNKDEVWGHLGKNKAQLRDTDGDVEEEYEVLGEDGDEPSKSDSKTIYVKNNFFDTLSCDALDRGQRNGRPRFSEQLKIDAETFGDFSRHHGARGGGRGFRGGRGRGSYYGRGYGYGGRGRGQSAPYRPF